MASMSPFTVLVFLAVFFANSQVLISTTDHPRTTSSASPAVSPYVTAPNISSFFPRPTGVDHGTPSSAASPQAEAPGPSSGEFVGKIFSSSTRLDCSAAIVGILLISSFLQTSMVV
ncbi:uncharacterized protein LOC129302468 [Prosopis cineraria]|uniref:uncharacterized protein LOC129296467 n=1 Tax=Prosopis cineraria TaxID=364024 RepID=UPI00240F7CB6|nr:uncharacterized protein LOC129296467 [Prosopis cineraria]XP_054797363.1 uncharacterized protein LOC129302468 [Prosopis cineraria]